MARTSGRTSGGGSRWCPRAARENAFIQSYRSELAHFVAVLQGAAPYEAPADQVAVYKLVEAVYKAAEEGREVRL
jgi:predicted dehydrogenase